MTNLLNTYIANQPINKPATREHTPAFTFDSKGKIKPMPDKGRLLPSRIFGSPIEYVKDLKKDVVNIGRAAKGEANDHELGRINDLAMKLGSLGLAAYLFVKNPLKLNKAMEFTGFATFFASMALWPKLAIQAPLKARTGVDIHQKYIDSQGRKKMLHQDPQYDLTDLYSREDLDKMGKKLGVSENIPDRDNFIKQRAKKTAVQGNTLWMMTAGIASPVMSALACNRLEKPIGKAIEKFDMVSSEKAINSGNYQGLFSGLRRNLSERSLNKFLTQNADKAVDNNLIKQLAAKLGHGVNSASLQSAIAEELAAMKNNIKIDENFVRQALNGKIPESVFTSLSQQQRTALNSAMESGSLNGIADVISHASGTGKRAQDKLGKEITKLLSEAKKKLETPKLSDIEGKVRTLSSGIADFSAGKKVLDKYITARVGDKSGTYIANQWNRVGESLMKSLKLSMKDLKAVSQGNIDIITEKLANLAANDSAYDKTVKELMGLIGDYEGKTGSAFTSTVKQKSKEICTEGSKKFSSKGFSKLAQKLISSENKSTVDNIINVNTAERVSGAQSSFYRLLQSLDLFKRIKDGSLEQQLASVLQESGKNADKTTINRLIKTCKDMMLTATTTDYVEKLKSAGFNLSEKEYKSVMKVLFDSGSDTAIEKSLSKTMGSEQAKKMLSGFKAYKEEFMNKVANWRNGMTPELSRRTVNGVTNGANAVERNNLAGKPIKALIQDVAKQTYNSKKWLMIFGGIMAGLTAITITAGLFLGRKGATEKQVEEESRANG